MATQVINKVSSINRGNFKTGGAFNPAKIRGLVLVRKGQDLLTTAQLATVQASLQAKMVNDTYSSRSFFIHELINVEDNGEGVSYESREQLKYKSDGGTWDKIFTLTGTYADHIQCTDLFSGKSRLYQAAFIDENNVLFHLESTTGIVGFDLHALEVLPRTEAISGTAVMYKIRVALRRLSDYDTCQHTELGFNPFTAITGVEPVILKEFGSSGNGVHEFTLTSPDEQENYVELYKTSGQLMQAGAWRVTLKEGGAAVTITSVAVVSSGTEAIQFKLTLDQTTYTNGDVAVVQLAVPSTIYGYIANYLEVLDTVEIDLVK